MLYARKIDCTRPDIKPTILATHNRQAELINMRELEKINSDPIEYSMRAGGKENHIEFLRKNCLAPEKLILKVGAQVMMLKNSLHKDGIINGSLGIVIDISSGGLPVVKFTNGKVINIASEEWVIEEFDQESKETKVLAKIKQIPLALAWAITVHKSQGMTLDMIECDLANAFEEGQVYVALSRAKSLDGVFLRSFNHNAIKANKRVIEFYNSIVL
jgi:ATP-dependent exoDNAse (exonuclease V) alpha subunit